MAPDHHCVFCLRRFFVVDGARGYGTEVGFAFSARAVRVRQSRNEAAAGARHPHSVSRLCGAIADVGANPIRRPLQSMAPRRPRGRVLSRDGVGKPEASLYRARGRHRNLGLPLRRDDVRLAVVTFSNAGIRASREPELSRGDGGSTCDSRGGLSLVAIAAWHHTRGVHAGITGGDGGARGDCGHRVVAKVASACGRGGDSSGARAWRIRGAGTGAARYPDPTDRYVARRLGRDDSTGQRHRAILRYVPQSRDANQHNGLAA